MGENKIIKWSTFEILLICTYLWLGSGGPAPHYPPSWHHHCAFVGSGEISLPIGLNSISSGFSSTWITLANRKEPSLHQRLTNLEYCRLQLTSKRKSSVEVMCRMFHLPVNLGVGKSILAFVHEQHSPTHRGLLGETTGLGRARIRRAEAWKKWLWFVLWSLADSLNSSNILPCEEDHIKHLEGMQPKRLIIELHLKDRARITLPFPVAWWWQKARNHQWHCHFLAGGHILPLTHPFGR